MMQKKLNLKTRGFSLVATMIALGIGVFVMLGLTQLLQLSRQQFTTTDNLARMYETARFSVNYLNSQVGRAGYGMVPPNSNPPVAFDSSGYNSTSTSYSGTAATYSKYLPGQAFVGCYSGLTSGTSIFDGTTNNWGFYGIEGCIYNLLYTNYLFFPANSQLLRFSYMVQNGGSQNCAYNFSNKIVTRTTVDGAKTAALCTNPCSGATTYNCGSTAYGSSGADTPIVFYESVFWPVNALLADSPDTIGTGTSTGTNSDTLTIYYTNQNNYTIPDCANGTVPAETSGSEIGQPASSTFSLSLRDSTDTLCTAASTTCSGQLTCTPRVMTYSAGTGGYTTNTAIPVTGVIEHMRVLLGEDTTGQRDSSGNKATSVGRWIQPQSRLSATSLTLSNKIDLTNIVAVRIALVVRSEDPILAVATQPTLNLMKGSGGTTLTYTPATADKYMRKVFVITIPFINFVHRNYPYNTGFSNSVTNAYFTNGVDYERHCVANGGSNFSIKVGGARNSAIATGDRCCSTNGTSCYSTYTTLAQCETDRIASDYNSHCTYFATAP